MQVEDSTSGHDPLATRPGSGRLAGKVAIVVGAGQTPSTGPDDTTIGNGRATALVFAREGAQVLCVDRDPVSLADTVAMIRAAGGEAVELVADITSETSAATIPTACLDAFGTIDVLHNNVGIGAGDKSAASVELDAWQRIFDVNVTGMMLTCRAVVPEMRTRGGGSIINISSVAAVASTSMAAYKASKAAVNALTHHLATANFAHGIRANVIMPGLMDTPMAIGGHSAATGADPDALREQRNRQVPLGRRMGTGWDTAYAALFLASDESRFITGVMLPVDGGSLARIG